MGADKEKILLILFFSAVCLLFCQLVDLLSTCSTAPSETILLRTHQNGDFPTVHKQERIVLFNFVYGEASSQKQYLRMFLESARYAKNVDFLIIGDHEPPFEFPPNAKHVLLSWERLIDILFEKVFEGKETGRVRRAQAYKVNDLKPLFAYLFPEYVEGYDWWGHVDNDMIVGNIRKWLTDEVLAESDIITDFPGSENGEFFTHGPFTMYRNNRINNELFKLSGLPLSKILGTADSVCFDEWGECGRMEAHVTASMSGIIHKFREYLGIRWRGNALPMSLDYDCHKNETWKGEDDCAPCEFRKGTIMASKTFYREEVEEVAFCHYQFSKARMEISLNATIMDEFVESGNFRVSYDKGFHGL